MTWRTQDEADELCTAILLVAGYRDLDPLALFTKLRRGRCPGMLRSRTRPTRRALSAFARCWSPAPNAHAAANPCDRGGTLRDPNCLRVLRVELGWLDFITFM